MAQKFELSLTSNYAHNWTVQDALRELLQNAIDQQVQIEDNEMNIDYFNDEYKLVISNKNSVLAKKSLLLGYSSKQDEESTIGQFGEGYKIALLVLLREGKTVTINNYGAREVWTSKLVKSRRYEGEKVLTVYVDNKAIWTKVPHNNLEIIIEGITLSEYQELIDRSLQLQNLDEHEYIRVYQGDILLNREHKGKIFVNGLYITTIDSFEYGYSIKPNYLQLGRDRNIVDSFDIQYLTSRMWENTGEDELLMPLIIEGKPEVRYLVTEWTKPNSIVGLSNKAYYNFKDKYGTKAIPVKSADEVLALKSVLSEVDPIVLDKVHYHLLTMSEHYNSDKLRFEDDSEASDYAKWKYKYKGSTLTDDAIKELDDIIAKLGGKINEEVANGTEVQVNGSPMEC